MTAVVKADEIEVTTEGQALLAWFDIRARDLPWRRSRDPFHIWVSEIMLQQTRVSVVIPYFERFMERFPSVGSLASAELTEVLVLWSGLGYYRRARQLHAAAVQVAESGGELPRSAQGLRSLPGIGAYTSAAVASIAFGEVIPVLDGNVERVMSRYLALEEDPRRQSGQRILREAAAELLDPQRPGDSNQALMELGATVCVPRSPFCGECPLNGGCRARQLENPESFPLPKPKRARERQVRQVVWVQAGEATLLFRRPADSAVLPDTWELPWVPDPGDKPTRSASAVEEALVEKYGGSWSVGSPVVKVRHSITFRALELRARRGEIEGGSLVSEGPEAGFFRPEDLAKQPLSSQVGKVMKAVEKKEAEERESGKQRSLRLES